MINAPAGGLDAGAMLTEQLAAYLLLDLEPEFDFFDGNLARGALSKAACVVAVTGYKTTAEYADVLLPMAMYAENEGSYLNMEGRDQCFNTVVSPPGDARPAWKTVCSLAGKLGLSGFSYNGFEEVRTEATEKRGNIQPDNMDAWLAPEAIPVSTGDLHRIGYVPMNSVDALVRHAPALQQTVDVADGVVHINSKTARRLGVAGEEKIRVSSQDNVLQLPLQIDDTVADDCVMIHGGHAGSGSLGPLTGPVSVSRV